MKNVSWLLCFLFILSLAACTEPITETSSNILGLRPIYADPVTAKEISNLPVQPIQQLGKIYYKAPYIFVSEIGKGIHVLDNTDPSDPIKIAFIQVIGNRDIAIKENYLYADNLTDLVVLDISSLNEIKLVKRIPDLYEKIDAFPPNYQGDFECVDDELGVVIGWESVTLDNPRCFR